MVIHDQERNIISYNAVSRALGIFFLFLFTGNAVLAQLTEPVSTNWALNGAVYGTARIGNTLYFTGGFTMVGAPVGGGMIVDMNGNQTVDLQVNNNIEAGVSDGAGGWYIGGTFNTVLGQTRKGLAHINANGTLNTWTADLEGGSVRKIIVSGSKVYVAGSFTSVNGVSRNGLACVDAVTGVVSSWNPNPNAALYDMALDGTNVYICGMFSAVGGQGRKGLAAVNQATGSVLSWNANPSFIVSALAVSGSTLYIGGIFNSIMSTSRNNVAAVNTSTFTLTSWNPGPTGGVSNFLIDGSTVYLYGSFSTIKGSSGNVIRNSIAAVDATTGIATSFDPVANNPGASISNIIGMNLIGGTMYLSGEYTVTNNPDGRSYLIAVDPATGVKTVGMDPGVGTAFPVLIPGNTNNYLLGGALMVKKGTVRQFAAAIDLVSGTLLPWNPKPNLAPWVLATSGSTVYMGGNFQKIGNDNRNNLAALDAISGKATSWNHSTDGMVRTMLVNNSTLYVGGAFQNVDGQSQQNLASFDLGTGNLNNWKPNPDGTVLGLAASGNTLYAGGEFRNIGGAARNFLAAVDAAGSATSWNPDMNGNVTCLGLNGSALYAGGDFTSVNNMVISRLGAAAYNTTNGNLLPWSPKVEGSVSTIYPTNDAVYLGGYISAVADQPCSNIAAVSASSASVLSWNPVIDYGVMNISLINNKVYVGGEYFRVNNKLKAGLSIFDKPLTLPLTWGNVTASLQRNEVLVSWTTLQETNTRNFIVQHSTDGVSWKDLGSVSAAGNSSTPRQYSYLHATPAEGNNYYRLVQYDLDGKNTNSRIVSVRTGELQKGFAIIGNPVSDGILKLQLSTATEVAVYSIDGKLVAKKYFSAGSQSIDVSAYPKGIYNVKVGKETGRVIIQ